MDDAVRISGFLLGLIGGPFAASLGYLATLQVLTRMGWFTTEETNRIEIGSIEFEVPVFKSKWHSVFLHATCVVGMVFVFVLYVTVIDLVFAIAD